MSIPKVYGSQWQAMAVRNDRPALGLGELVAGGHDGLHRAHHRIHVVRRQEAADLGEKVNLK